MHPHQSDHDHDDLSPPEGEAPGYYEIMETAVRELLVERRLIDPARSADRSRGWIPARRRWAPRR